MLNSIPELASTTSFKNTGKATTIKRLRTMSIARPAVPNPQVPHSPGSMRARTAIFGSIANLGAGIVLGILQAKMKEEMLKSLEQMPKPKIDRRSAATFFSDPNTGKAIRVIDLFAKNLKPFEQEIRKHHAGIIAATNLEIAMLAISSLSVDERLEFLTGLEEEHNIYGQQLFTVYDNLSAAKSLSAKANEAARAAEDLSKMLDRALVADWLLKNGFSFDEIVQIYSNRQNYAARVRSVFQQIDELHALAQRLIDEQSAQASQVNKIYWVISLSRVAEELKKRGLQ